MFSRVTWTVFVFLPVLAGAREPSERAGRGDPWERISQYDADGDGVVSGAEFGGPAWVMARFDRDGDGLLTGEEVASAGFRGRPRRAMQGGRTAAAAAPRVGDPAPAVAARPPGSEERIDLSQPERVTVLVFGSHT